MNRHLHRERIAERGTWMKRRHYSLSTLSCLLFLLAISSCTATLDAGKPPSASCFMRTYGGTFDEDATSVQVTPDGGYIALGTTSTVGPGAKDFYLVKFDATGIAQWQQEFGTKKDDAATALVQTSDGYVMLGTTTGFEYAHTVSPGFFLVKSNLSGSATPIWNEHFKIDSNLSYQSSALLALPDGGFLVAGWSWSSTDTSIRTPCLIRLDDTGYIIWAHSYPDTTDQKDTRIHGVVRTTDGGFVAVGGQTSKSSQPSSIYFLKTDANGIETQATTIPTTIGEGFGIDLDPNGYVVYGYTKTISSSLPLASTIYVSPAFGFSVGPAPTQPSTDNASQFNAGCRTSDGGTISIGTTNATTNGSNDIIIMKVDAHADVNPQWVHTFGGPRSDVGMSVSQAPDGGYILLGTTESFGTSVRTGDDIILIKVDVNGQLCN